MTVVAALGWIGRGIYTAVSVAGYGFRVSEEVKDSKVGELVSQKLANCTSTCCIAGWPEITKNLRPVPLLSLATSVIVPFAGYGVGLVIAHTASKCKITCCVSPKKGVEATTYQKVTLVGRAVAALSLAIILPFSAYFEKTDAALIQKVSDVFYPCILQNATVCCISGAKEVLNLVHDSSSLSLVSAIALPVAMCALGILTYQDVVGCCKAKSRVDMMPGSASYSSVATDDEM